MTAEKFITGTDWNELVAVSPHVDPNAGENDAFPNDETWIDKSTPGGRIAILSEDIAELDGAISLLDQVADIGYAQQRYGLHSLASKLKDALQEANHQASIERKKMIVAL